MGTRGSGWILTVALCLAPVPWPSAAAIIGTITTVAGTGSPGLAGEGGPATAAELNEPRQLALDAAGNLFLAEVDNHRVRRIDTAGIITTIAGTTAGFSGDGALATAAQLRRPTDVALDAAGNVFVADLDNHRIRRVDATTGIITTVAGSTPGFSGDGGPATAAELFAPYAVTSDGPGNLFIADLGNARVRRIDAVTGIITTVAGTGTEGFSGDDGPAIAAEVDRPIDLALDAAGNLFIADFLNQRVRRVDVLTGLISTVAGNGTLGFRGDGGPATAARLASPVGIGLDVGGNLFVAEIDNRRVRRIDAATGIITTVAGTGGAGVSGDGGPATGATMETPFGVVLHPNGALFIADRAAHRIRRADAVANPCPSGGAAVSPRLSVRATHPPAGDDRFSFEGFATLPFPFIPVLDPVAKGVRLVITDFLETATLLDATIPPVVGWRAGRSATAWSFAGAGAGGITRVRLRTSASQPGVVRFRMRGSHGSYGAMTLPVAAILVLDPPAATTEQCAVATWPASPPVSPSCMLTSAGRGLQCR